jgi:hypothetical protein
MAHAYNSSYVGDIGMGVVVQGQPQAKCDLIRNESEKG